MSANLSAALGYADLGWPVFPCRPPKNTPATAHGFYDATLDPEQIHHWWRTDPTASIACRTGVAFDVLDIDHNDFVTGVADLPDCETDGGPVACSGGGKWHLYFKPTGIGRRIRFSAHCDWLGGDGYVIVPPSGHKSGGTYSWYAPAHLALTDAPAALVDMARRPTPEPPPNTVTPTSLATLTAGGWSASGLIATLATAPEGERNSALNWAALRVGNGVADGKITPDQARDVLIDLEAVALRAGLGDKETILTIRSGFAAGTAGKR